MRKFKNYSGPTSSLICGGTLLCIVALSLIFSGCSSTIVAKCQVGRENVQKLESPEPPIDHKMINGQLANMTRLMVEERELDNLRKDGLLQEIETCEK